MKKMSEKGYVAWGHGTTTTGGNDGGCVYGNYTEAGLVGPIVKACVTQLRKWGITVKSDVGTNNDRNMIVCVSDANAYGAEFYFSIHCDYDQAPSGTYPIAYPGSTQGIKLAQCLTNAVQARLPIGTRGILQTDYYEVRATNMPACIFETGGIKSDLTILRDRAQEYGYALACGVMDYLGKEYNNVESVVQAASTPTAVLTPTTTTVEDICCQFDDENIVVGQMQRDLRAMGYTGTDGSPLIVDDDFGANTKHAVLTLQKLHGLVQDGIYGPKSDAALMAEITKVQKALCAKGYKVNVDGAIGNETHNQLVKFQADNGLVADGIVGTKTEAALGIKLI